MLHRRPARLLKEGIGLGLGGCRVLSEIELITGSMTRPTYVSTASESSGRNASVTSEALLGCFSHHSLM